MGINDLQALHQKAKNSTSCGLPALSFTLLGSLGVNSVLMGFVALVVGWNGVLRSAGAGRVGSAVEQAVIKMAVIKIIKSVFFMGLTFFLSSLIVPSLWILIP